MQVPETGRDLLDFIPCISISIFISIPPHFFSLTICPGQGAAARKVSSSGLRIKIHKHHDRRINEEKRATPPN